MEVCEGNTILVQVSCSIVKMCVWSNKDQGWGACPSVESSCTHFFKFFSARLTCMLCNLSLVSSVVKHAI